MSRAWRTLERGDPYHSVAKTGAAWGRAAVGLQTDPFSPEPQSCLHPTAVHPPRPETGQQKHSALLWDSTYPKGLQSSVPHPDLKVVPKKGMSSAK